MKLGKLAVTLVLSLLLIPVADAADSSGKPNVLFIAIDDLNHWVGYLGRNKQTKTPNIDKLAARGVRFTRSYCAAPVCNPSRAALMSGKRPGETGVYDNNQDWRNVIPEEQTLTSQFRKAGYVVYGAGKIYHSSVHRPTEWDDYLDKEGGEPGTFGKRAKDGGVGGIRFAPLDCDDSAMPDYNIVNYGIKRLNEKHDQPFFLAVGLHKPHMPWNVPQKYYDMHALESIELPPHLENDLDDVPSGGIRMAKPNGDHADILKSGRWKEAVQGYLAAITFCDTMIGRLIDALDKSPHRDNTIICFWGDHGWHLGEKQHWRKFALWEESTRAPLIFVVPGLTKPSSVCDRTVDFMSIYPTLCDLTGLSVPAHVRGPSLRPLLADPKAPWKSPAITTFHLNNHGVRTDGFRYIRYADGGEELYDEAVDPFEWKNLATDPKFAATKAAMTKLLPTDNVDELPAGKSDEAKPKKDNKKANK